MKPLRFQATNLLSIGEADLDLTKRGLLLVTGYSFDEQNENGAGKSNVAANGLIWTMYGHTPNDVKSDEVINCHNPDETSIGIYDFTAVDGVDYRVTRKRNPTHLSLHRKDDSGDFSLDISSKTAQQTQAMIDQLLGKSRQAFMQTDYFGSSKSMNYARLSGLEQREVLESIMPLVEFDRYAQYAGVLIAKLNTEREQLGLQISTIHGRIIEVENQIERSKTSVQQYELDRSRRLEELKTKLSSRPDVSKLPPAESVRSDLQEVGASAQMLYNNLIKLGQEIKSFQFLKKNTLCPTCRQFVSSDKTDAEIDKHNQHKTDMEAQYQELSEKYMGLKDRYTELSMMQEIWNDYKSYDSLSAEFTNLQAAVNPYTDALTTSTQSHQDLKKHEELTSKKLSTLITELEYLGWWYTAFSRDIRLAALASVCPFLDARTNHHLNQMQNNQLHVAFSTVKLLASGVMKEDFNVQAWSDTGGKSFKALSNGEQRLVSFAIGLALGDLAASGTSGGSKLLILDEPFVQLSTRNAEAIIQYITNVLGKDKDTILLISNEEPLKSLIHNRVHVIKRNGITTIEGNP